MNDNIYYLGLYMDDEFNCRYKYLLNNKSPDIDDFNYFFEVEKISNNKYVILDFIKEHDFGKKLKLGDVLVSIDSMITLEVYRDNKLIYDGIEKFYVIKKEEFEGLYDNSIDYLIDKLYNKLKNYYPIQKNPYEDIYLVLQKRFE